MPTVPVYVHNQIVRSNRLQEGGLYWVLKCETLGSGVTFGANSKTKVEITGPSGCAGASKEMATNAAVGQSFVTGYHKDGGRAFNVKISITDVTFDANAAENIIEFRTLTYSSGPVASGNITCRGYSGEPTLTNMVGTDTDPLQTFWVNSSPSQVTWLLVDKSCAPKAEQWVGNVNTDQKGTTPIMPCDPASTSTGNVQLQTASTGRTLLYKGHKNAGTCWPKWILCDPNKLRILDTGEEDPANSCWTGKRNCPSKGSLIRIDKTQGLSYRECYEVQDVRYNPPSDAECGSVADGCKEVPCEHIDDGSKKGCTRAGVGGPPSEKPCLRLDHSYVQSIGGPGTGCGACGGEDPSGQSYHLAEILARTLQDLGWAENLGGFQVTRWKGRGLNLGNGTYQEYDATHMRAHGHSTREKFAIPGNAAVLRKAGKTQHNFENPLAINEVSMWYAANASFQTTWTWMERWRQAIEMSTRTLNAGEKCPCEGLVGCVCTGNNVYKITDSWPPEYVEMFIRKTQTSQASVQAGGTINRFFEFGISFDAVASETIEGGSFPNTTESVSIGARAWVKLNNLISYNARMTGSGEQDDGGLGIAKDTINIQIDLGSANFSGSMKKYEDEWQGKPNAAGGEWDNNRSGPSGGQWTDPATGHVHKWSKSNTLFKTISCQADWDIKLTNGWTVNISGVGYREGELIVAPVFNMSAPFYKDQIIWTVTQDLEGNGGIGLAFNSKESLLPDEIKPEWATMFINAGILYDTSINFSGDTRYSPSMGFYGSVGDVSQSTSKILRGFEYDVNLIEGKAKIKGANIPLFNRVSNATYTDPSTGQKVPYRKASMYWRWETNVADPDAPVFSIGADAAFEWTVYNFEAAWAGAFVVRARATMGFQIGGNAFGGISGGTSIGGSVWCGIQWRNSVLSFLNFPFDIFPGVGLGIGYEFRMKAKSSAPVIGPGGEQQGNQTGSGTGFKMELGMISFEISAADSLRQHLRRQRIPLMSHVPLLGKCLSMSAGLPLVSNNNVGMPVISVLGPKESLIRYLLRFHAMKSMFAIEQAIDDYKNELIRIRTDCKNEFPIMWRALQLEDRHQQRWHFHQDQSAPPDILEIQNPGGGNSRWTPMQQSLSGGAKCDGPGPTGSRITSCNGICPTNKPTGNPGEYWMKGKQSTLNWRVRDEFCLIEADGSMSLNASGHRKLKPVYNKCRNKLGLCWYEEWCVDDWKKNNQACTWIKSRYKKIDFDKNAQQFDLNTYPQLRGQRGLVQAVINAIHYFMWNKIFVGCSSWSFVNETDIDAFIDYLRPFWGSFSEFGDPLTSKINQSEKGGWQETKTCLRKIFCNEYPVSLSTAETRNIRVSGGRNIQLGFQSGMNPALDLDGINGWDADGEIAGWDSCQKQPSPWGGNCGWLNKIACQPLYFIGKALSSGTSWLTKDEDGCPPCQTDQVSTSSVGKASQCQEGFHNLLKFWIMYSNVIHDMWILSLGCSLAGFECCESGKRDRDGACEDDGVDVTLGGNAAQMSNMNGVLRMLLKANTAILSNKSGGERFCNQAYLWELYHELATNAKVEAALTSGAQLLRNMNVCKLAADGTCVHEGGVRDLNKSGLIYKWGSSTRHFSDGEEAVSGAQVPLFWPEKSSMGCLAAWHGKWPAVVNIHSAGFNCWEEVWECGNKANFKKSDEVAINAAHYFFCHLCQSAGTAENNTWWDGDMNRAHVYPKCRTAGWVFGLSAGDVEQSGAQWPYGPNDVSDAGRSYGAERRKEIWNDNFSGTPNNTKYGVTRGCCGSWYEVDGPGPAVLGWIPILGADVDFESPLREITRTWNPNKMGSTPVNEMPAKKQEIYNIWTKQDDKVYGGNDKSRDLTVPDKAGQAATRSVASGLKSSYIAAFDEGAWDSIFKRHPYIPPAAIVGQGPGSGDNGCGSTPCWKAGSFKTGYQVIDKNHYGNDEPSGWYIADMNDDITDAEAKKLGINKANVLGAHYDWACWFVQDQTVKATIPSAFYLGGAAASDNLKYLISAIQDWTMINRGQEYDAHNDQQHALGSAPGAANAAPLWKTLPKLGASAWKIKHDFVDYGAGKYSCTGSSQFKEIDMSDLQHIPTAHAWKEPIDIAKDMSDIVDHLRAGLVWAAFYKIYDSYHALIEARTTAAINNVWWRGILNGIERDLVLLSTQSRMLWIKWLNSNVTEIKTPTTANPQQQVLLPSINDLADQKNYRLWDEHLDMGSRQPMQTRAQRPTAAELRQWYLQPLGAGQAKILRTPDGKTYKALGSTHYFIKLYDFDDNEVAFDSEDERYGDERNVAYWKQSGSTFYHYCHIHNWINTFSLVPWANNALMRDAIMAAVEATTFKSGAFVMRQSVLTQVLNRIKPQSTSASGGTIKCIGPIAKVGRGANAVSHTDADKGVPWHFIINGNMEYLEWDEDLQKDADKSALRNILSAPESLNRSVGWFTSSEPESGIFPGAAMQVNFRGMSLADRERTVAMVTCGGFDGKVGVRAGTATNPAASEPAPKNTTKTSSYKTSSSGTVGGGETGQSTSTGATAAYFNPANGPGSGIPMGAGNANSATPRPSNSSSYAASSGQTNPASPTGGSTKSNVAGSGKSYNSPSQLRQQLLGLTQTS